MVQFCSFSYFSSFWYLFQLELKRMCHNISNITEILGSQGLVLQKVGSKSKMLQLGNSIHFQHGAITGASQVGNFKRLERRILKLHRQVIKCMQLQWFWRLPGSTSIHCSLSKNEPGMQRSVLSPSSVSHVVRITFKSQCSSQQF